MTNPYDYSKVDDFIDMCESIASEIETFEAFDHITGELKDVSDRYLNDCIAGLNFLQTEMSIEWIEANAARIANVSLSWGHLAATSGLTWNCIERWLNLGRPLSLVAIDGLNFCTTVGERLNQSPLMRELNPRLPDLPELEEVVSVLREYLTSDNVHRTRTGVEAILKNVELLKQSKSNAR